MLCKSSVSHSFEIEFTFLLLSCDPAGRKPPPSAPPCCPYDVVL